LVVIAVITLLMAILVPSLQRVRRQTKAVVCQSNLRQWGQAFSIYADDYDGKLFGMNSRNPLGRIYWVELLRPYWSDCNDLLLCPMAAKYEIRQDDPWWFRGSKSTAWVWVRKDGIISASYGTNMNVGYSPGHYVAGAPVGSDSYGAHRWGSVVNVKGSSSIPALFDCTSQEAGPWHSSDGPPEYEDEMPVGPGDGMKEFCINRHDGGINSLFLDWSVCKVGLKELWTLKWNPVFSTAGCWTKAGGVEPEDWPEWMRKFKDY
jgi:prepilin-type processing-associated H-X9-DG protein